MIGIISDTHENEEAMNKAAEIFKQKNFDLKDELEFEHKGTKFYVYHGTDMHKLDAAIKSNKYDYILTGRTHAKRDKLEFVEIKRN